jgi:hypothetical protein
MSGRPGTRDASTQTEERYVKQALAAWRQALGLSVDGWSAGTPPRTPGLVQDAVHNIMYALTPTQPVNAGVGAQVQDPILFDAGTPEGKKRRRIPEEFRLKG